MADNFEIMYGSGAGVTLRATEAGSLADGDQVYTLHTNGAILDSSGNPIASSNPLDVQITDGTNASEVLAAGADNITNTTNQFVVGSFGYMYDGATWDRMRGDSTNGLLVNLGANNDVIIKDSGGDALEIESDGSINVNTSPANTPPTYNKMTQNSETFNIVKGDLNKLRIRPQIQNEYAESSREAMDSVDASTVVGQMFRVSQPNINGISMTLQSGAAFASMDSITANTGSSEQKAGTMEYSSDAEMQEEWIKSGAVEAVRSAFTDNNSVTQDGNWAIKVPMDVAGVEWRVTLTSTNLTGVTFSIKYASTKEWNKAKAYFFIGDGTNTKSYPMTLAAKDLWQTFKFSEISMAVTGDDDTVTTPTMTAITKMGFRITDSDAGEFAYADSITYQAKPGSLNMELWDMGASLPASNGTVNYTTAGTQYEEIGDRGIGGVVVSTYNLSLIGGKRKYHIDGFIAGTAPEKPDNTLLTTGNYYAIVLKYVDTDVVVYGPDTTIGFNYYTSGYGWKAETANNLIDIIPGAAGAGAYSDLMFQIFSTQDVYIVNAHLLTDSAPGTDADVAIFSEGANMEIDDIIASVQTGGFGRTELPYDIRHCPSFLENGGKFEAYFNDDPTDAVTMAAFSMQYKFIPPTVYG